MDGIYNGESHKYVLRDIKESMNKLIILKLGHDSWLFNIARAYLHINMFLPLGFLPPVIIMVQYSILE